MKKVYIAGLATMLFFAACENNGSSTVGSYDKEDESSTSANENISKEQSGNNETDSTKTVSPDTAKNITGISKDSVSPKKAKDSTTAMDKQNVKIQKTKKIETKP